jgi:quinol-cytochrome oxidoreductase complex cytochrome b subunit
MSVDYSKQYRPDQLEPFWPNEVVKMSVAVLCTLAIIMLLAILPVVLEGVGIHVHHAEEPANPHGGTPPGIKPEWYFLAVYQHLKLMPTQLLGVDGKMLGVLSQGVGVMVVIGLPFWYRRKAHDRPGWLYRTVVTSTIFGFLGPSGAAGPKRSSTARNNCCRSPPTSANNPCSSPLPASRWSSSTC